MNKALLVIDLQLDYFPDGKFPLWDTEAVLARVVSAIEQARKKNLPVIFVQHIAKAGAPFFVEGSKGAELHPRVVAAASGAPVVIKRVADSFYETSLESVLCAHAVTELFVCGMMTQNCVTHTAISKSAEKYKVSVLGDCCTTVSEILHKIALSALAIRLPVVTAETALG